MRRRSAAWRVLRQTGKTRSAIMQRPAWSHSDGRRDGPHRPGTAVGSSRGPSIAIADLRRLLTPFPPRISDPMDVKWVVIVDTLPPTIFVFGDPDRKRCGAEQS